jgi:hypothetical protein
MTDCADCRTKRTRLTVFALVLACILGFIIYVTVGQLEWVVAIISLVFSVVFGMQLYFQVDRCYGRVCTGKTRIVLLATAVLAIGAFVVTLFLGKEFAQAFALATTIVAVGVVYANHSITKQSEQSTSVTVNFKGN